MKFTDQDGKEKTFGWSDFHNVATAAVIQIRENRKWKKPRIVDHAVKELFTP